MGHYQTYATDPTEALIMSYTELTVWTRGIIMDSACGPGERATRVEPPRAGVGPREQ